VITEDDVGGVHIKYLYHCHRQLWLYSRGIRPEHLSTTVQRGEAVHDTTYTRTIPVDLGSANSTFSTANSGSTRSNRRPVQPPPTTPKHATTATDCEW
jgi:CRISPR-associated exonuclease Cas4